MENNQIVHEYLEVFSRFMSEYKRAEVSGEEVGEAIMKLAHYYAKYNMQLVAAERRLSIVAAENERGIDEASGKPISSAKAKTYTDASPESHAYLEARAHVQNIEQFINSLKSLQKGVMNEYAHS